MYPWGGKKKFDYWVSSCNQSGSAKRLTQAPDVGAPQGVDSCPADYTRTAEGAVTPVACSTQLLQTVTPTAGTAWWDV